jgi:hypothetical protein
MKTTNDNQGAGQMIENKNITIANNSGADLAVIHNHLIEYAKTEIIHDDIADLLSLERFVDGENVKIIVNFLED